MRNKTILILVLLSQLAFGQNVIKDTLNVKKPAKGKLYFQEKDNNLYLYRNGYELIKTDEATVTPPPVVQEEVVLGYWNGVERVLVAKLIDNQYWLMQRSVQATYYVARGKNLLGDNLTKVVNKEFDLELIKSADSELNGLYKPLNFPELVFLATGYYKNSQGEYIPNGTVTPPITGKVKVPVGAFRWDGFYDDYLLNPRKGIDGVPYDNGINHTTVMRVDMSEFTEANVVPFFGQQYLTPERVPLERNGRWVCTAFGADGKCVAGENQFDYVYKNVTVKYDLTPTAIEKEIGYAKDAGIDYWLFLWYSPYDSPMAEAMHKFTQLPNKQGMKMAIKLGGSFGWDITKNAKYVANCMKSDYYQKIDGKVLLYVEPNFKYLQEVLKEYGSNDVYIVTSGDYNDYPSTNRDASTIYITAPPRLNTDPPTLKQLPHDRTTQLEIEMRNRFVSNTANKNTKIVPLLTTGSLNYVKRSSLNNPKVEYWSDKASNQDWDNKFKALIEFIDANPNKVPTILLYSWNENSESGNPICPTLAEGTSSVNVSTINTAGVTVGINRSTLDKVKQYCKK